MRNDRPSPARLRGFTLIEMLVVIAIIALLATLLAPSLTGARRKAQAATCSSLQRQCAVALVQHADDTENFLAPIGHASGWDGVGMTEWWYARRWLGRYLDMGSDSSKGVRCPAVKTYGIGYNHPQIGVWLDPAYSTKEFWYRMAQVAQPSATIGFADVATIANPGEPDPAKWIPLDPLAGNVLFRTPDNMPYFDSMPQRAINRHGDKMASAWLDGHATVLSVTEIGFTYPLGDAKSFWDR